MTRETLAVARTTAPKRTSARLAAALISGSLLGAPALAQDAHDPSVLWEDAEISGQARYRYERVDEDGFDNNANASTVRLKATLETGQYRGLSVLVEGEGTAVLGPDNFNSTQNGEVTFPVVADPGNIELNRAQLKAEVHERVDVTIGRQRIEFGNERFVGNVGFRQDEQTFDAIRFDAEPHERVDVTIAAGNRVNTIFGSENSPTFPSGTLTGGFVLSNAEARLSNSVKATIYGHWLDFEEAPELSTRTIGARLDGDHDVGSGVVLGWTGEYAYQTETSDNPLDIDLFYARGEGRIKVLVGELFGGVEVLDGNGTVGFSTPLSTLHVFNGKADVFLVTPEEGLREGFLGWRSDLPGISIIRQWQALVSLHTFASDDGSIDLGREINAILRARFNKHVASSLEYAQYGSGEDPVSPPDTSRFWFTLDLTY